MIKLITSIICTIAIIGHITSGVVASNLPKYLSEKTENYSVDEMLKMAEDEEDDIIVLPNETGVFTYSVENDNPIYSDFGFIHLTDTTGIKVECSTNAEKHNFTVDVLEAGNDKLVYRKNISVGAYSQVFRLERQLFEKGKVYCIRLSDVDVADASGNISISAISGIDADDNSNSVGEPVKVVVDYLEEHKDDVINREKDLMQSVEDLVSMKFIQGFPDGELHLEDNVTRAQLAEIICRIKHGINFRHYDKAHMEKIGYFSNYTDLPDDHWAITSISALSGLQGYNILEGYGDGTIKPEGDVTYIEAANMILRLLNYFKLIDEKGGYPEGTKYWAEDLKLFERTNALKNLEAPATRGDIIVMLSTALDSNQADTLDENCIRTGVWQKGPLTLRQYRDMNSTIDERDAFKDLDA